MLYKMKNRLQIRYHIEPLLTRDEAKDYLKNQFAVGATNTKDNKTLPGEPLVILYNNDKTLGPAEALATANVILAIGRGGDGISRYNNQEYFVIDFAEHDEQIQALLKDSEEFSKFVEEIKTTVEEIKKQVEENTGSIQNIVKTIGEKGDNSSKDTVYGFIQGAYDDIAKEVNRAVYVEQELRHAIKDEETRAVAKENDLQTQINTESERAKQAEADLQAHIETEENARIEGDEKNRDAINAIESRLTDLLNTEVNRAINAETELSRSIEIEKDDRKTADDNLQAQITELSHNLTTETSARQNEDAKLEVKITDNSRRIKENQVSSSGKTVIVTGPSENGTNLEVNVDNKTIVVNEAGTLSVASDALVQYNGVNAIKVSDVAGGTKTISLDINSNDKVLTNDAQGLLATLSLKWVRAEADGEKDEIQLIGKDSKIISRIDVADFIKDGILDSVSLNTTDEKNPYLSFTFNSAAGKENINVPIKALVDIYLAGNGLMLNENIFSIKVDDSSEVFLTVSENGLKLSGIQNAIDNAKTEVKTHIDHEVEVLTMAISNLTIDLNEKTNQLAQADSNIITDYKNADAQLEVGYQTADNVIRNEFAAADTLLHTTLTQEFTSANNSLKEELHAKDDELEKAYIALSTTVEENHADAKQYTDSEILKVNNEIINSQKVIDKITGDVNVDGSIKDIVFDSALGAIVTTVTVENATEQSLIKKFTNEGTPYVYVSNSTTDMKHNGDALNNVLDGLRDDINNTLNATEEIKASVEVLSNRVDGHDGDIALINTNVANNSDNILILRNDVAKLQEDVSTLEQKVTDTMTSLLAEMQATITTLQNNLEAVKNDLKTAQDDLKTTKTDLASTQAELQTLKENAITTITGVDNEITVSMTDKNTAVVGFAADAYFVAG